MPTAGVKGAAAKNIQIKEIIVANPIVSLVIDPPKTHRNLTKRQIIVR